MFRQVNFPVVLKQIAGFFHMCRTGDEVRLLIAEGSVMMCFENNGIARQFAYPGLM
jgi:hypothetical protein